MPESLPCEQFLRLVRESRRVLLTGPSDPDGDSIGSCLALARMLARVCDARVDVAGTVVHRYAALPDVDRMIPDEEIVGPYDLAVVLDGDRRRLGPRVGSAFQQARATALVDHHSSSSRSGYTVALLDTGAASTCEVIHRVLRAWDLPLDQDLAALLYAGTVFDTGGFRHTNTTPATHALATELLSLGIDHTAIINRILYERSPRALLLLGRVLADARFLESGAVALGRIPVALSGELGTTYPDAEGIVDVLVYTDGVEVAVLAVERAPGVVKLSLRSRGRVNVASLARSLDPSGGGHPRAAGVVLEHPLEVVVERVCQAVAEAVRSV